MYLYYYTIIIIIYFQDKQTPLHIAAQQGHVSVVQCLITSGADLEAVDDVSLKLVC